MEKNIYYSTVFILFLFIGIQSLYAQGTGTVSGTVVDKASGEALIGVNVFLEGTSIGTASFNDGKYILHQVPAGTYNIGVKTIIEINNRIEVKEIVIIGTSR